MPRHSPFALISLTFRLKLMFYSRYCLNLTLILLTLIMLFFIFNVITLNITVLMLHIIFTSQKLMLDGKTLIKLN